MGVLQTGLLGMGIVLLGLACLQDWALRLVSNRIPAAIAVSGFVIRCIDGTILAGLSASAIVFLVAAGCWRRGWLGGADVKLFGAGAMLVPPGAVTGFVLATCLAGGVLALLYAAAGQIVPAPAAGPRPPGRFRRYLRMEQQRLRRRGPLPYATAIAAGALFVLMDR